MDKAKAGTVLLWREKIMVSMKDVARECGVSVATVSKALNDYSDVGEEKRREIKETARRPIVRVS